MCPHGDPTPEGTTGFVGNRALHGGALSHPIALASRCGADLHEDRDPFQHRVPILVDVRTSTRPAPGSRTTTAGHLFGGVKDVKNVKDVWAIHGRPVQQGT